MKKAIGMLLAFSLMTFSPAALAAGTGTNEVNISYKVQLGAEDFKLGGITAQRYGSAYVFTLRYQSGKDRLCAVVEPQSAGGAFDMVQLPATKDWGTCQLDRTVNEVNTAKSLTLTISADREEAVKSPTTITMTNLAEDLKGLRQQSADSVTLPLLRSFVSKDVTLGNLTIRLDGDNFKFTLDYDVGAPRLISIFDPPAGGSVAVYDFTKPLTGTGVYTFSVPVKSFAGVATFSIKLMTADQKTADWAFPLNVRSLARLTDGYQPVIPLSQMKLLGTAMQDGHGGYLLPLRAVFEGKGHEVAWDGKTNTVHITYHFKQGTSAIVFTVGSDQMTMGGQPQPLGGPVVNIGGKTYAPAGSLTGLLAVTIDPSTLGIYTKTDTAP